MTTKPALTTRTTLHNDATKDVDVIVKRTVTYVINITTSANLRLPYAVAVDGVVQEAYKTRSKRVSGRSGIIRISNVNVGAEVTLFLNSDAHPKYRRTPVYAVTAQDRDVIVTIDERLGKRPETDTPVRIRDNDTTVEEAKKADSYIAVLTGDIWMKVSHKYSSTEIDALLPPDTSPNVATAVKKIYDGLTQPSLTILVPSEEPISVEKTLVITFADGKNPRENISTGYGLLTEGLPRVHPAGYAAIFTAAIDAGISKVEMTSAWRPMLGSIAHRAGLGLDLNYLGGTRMNREELRKTDAVDTGNVSSEEKRLLAAFEMSKAGVAAARKEIALADADVNKANGEAHKLIMAKQRLKDAAAAGAAAEKASRNAEVAWNAERDKNEAQDVRKFRSSLVKCKSIAQIFDPWFTDSDNRDNVAPTPNMQQNANEKLHAHHLHITVYEPEIL